jgi:kinesin family member 2/24
METEREERRKEMIQRKQARLDEHAKLVAAGNPGDVDFIGMVEEWRLEHAGENEESNDLHQQFLHAANGTTANIIVAVRKRPMSDRERKNLDHDSVSCYTRKIWIHSAKFKVDGITKYLTHTGFQFDHAFGDGSTTDQIYLATTMPLVDHVVSTQGRATVFCYGQTGSGKTYTMSGIQQILAHDLFGELRDRGMNVEITLAFFELYGGFIQDLLHDRQRCKLLEDGKGEVNITGLREVPAPSATSFLKVIEAGHR